MGRQTADNRAGVARTGHSPGQRQLRVGEELRHMLAEVLARGELRDPDLQNRTVTVSEVRLSPDLKNATAFVMPLGGEHGTAVVAALRRSAPYLRRLLGGQLQMRHTPQLAFELDRTFDEASKIAQLLHRPDVIRDLGDPETPEGGDITEG